MQFFALPVARILLSLMFIWAGYTKVIGYGGMGMQVWIEAVKGMTIPGTANPLPSPELLAQISGWAELIGGLMLLIGILSRLTAFGLFLFSYDGLAYQYLWPTSVWAANHAVAMTLCRT